jgi:hypothetical protein
MLDNFNSFPFSFLCAQNQDVAKVANVKRAVLKSGCAAVLFEHTNHDQRHRSHAGVVPVSDVETSGISMTISSHPQGMTSGGTYSPPDVFLKGKHYVGIRLIFYCLISLDRFLFRFADPPRLLFVSNAETTVPTPFGDIASSRDSLRK